MLSRNLEKTLRRALALANARQHEYATLEHLLMALLDDEDALAVLKACAVGIMRERTDGLLSRLWVLPVHRASGLLARLAADAVRCRGRDPS